MHMWAHYTAAWPEGVWLACTIQPTYTRMLVKVTVRLRPSGTVSHTLSITISFKWPFYFWNFTVPADCNTLYSRGTSCRQVKWNALRDKVWFITWTKKTILCKSCCHQLRLALSQTSPYVFTICTIMHTITAAFLKWLSQVSGVSNQGWYMDASAHFRPSITARKDVVTVKSSFLARGSLSSNLDSKTVHQHPSFMVLSFLRCAYQGLFAAHIFMLWRLHFLDKKIGFRLQYKTPK